MRRAGCRPCCRGRLTVNRGEAALHAIGASESGGRSCHTPSVDSADRGNIDWNSCARPGTPRAITTMYEMRGVARVPPFDRRATYEDLVALPDNLVAEIVDGELHASPRPAPRHAVAEVAIGTLIATPFHFGRGGPGGWWILPEPEIHLSADVVVPDFGGWRRTRMPSPPETAYFGLAPDWVCEILLPRRPRSTEPGSWPSTRASRCSTPGWWTPLPARSRSCGSRPAAG